MPVPLWKKTRKRFGVKVLTTTNTTPTTANAAADELDKFVYGPNSRVSIPDGAEYSHFPSSPLLPSHYSIGASGSCPWLGWSELPAKKRNGTHPSVCE
jgi:hypothetical protein